MTNLPEEPKPSNDGFNPPLMKHAGRWHFASCDFPTVDQAVCNCPPSLKPEPTSEQIQANLDRVFGKNGENIIGKMAHENPFLSFRKEGDPIYPDSKPLYNPPTPPELIEKINSGKFPRTSPDCRPAPPPAEGCDQRGCVLEKCHDNGVHDPAPPPVREWESVEEAVAHAVYGDGLPRNGWSHREIKKVTAFIESLIASVLAAEREMIREGVEKAMSEDHDGSFVKASVVRKALDGITEKP